MIKYLAVATAAWLSTLSVTALADENCKTFDDVDGKFMLGDILLGSDGTQFMSDWEKEACRDDRGGEDCFAEKDGLSYVIDGSGSFWGVSIAELKVGRTYRGTLIAGIRISDSLERVRRKLGSLPAGFPEWHQDIYPDDSPYLYTDDCLRSSTGYFWHYILGFDPFGHLIYVAAIVKDFDRDT